MPDDLPALIAHAGSQAIGDLLRRSAARNPEKTAIVYRDLRQTYAELDITVNRTAAALAARGIGPGDRVVLFSHNNHAFVVAYFALARLGAVSVPVNFMLTADDVAYVLAHSGAVGLIAEDALVPVAEQALAKQALAEQALAGQAGPAGLGAAGRRHHRPRGDSRSTGRSSPAGSRSPTG